MYSTDNGPHMNTLARRGDDAVPQREEHQLGGRVPRAADGPLAGQDPRRRRVQRDRPAPRLAADVPRRRRRAGHRREAQAGPRGRRQDVQGAHRRLQPAALPDRRGDESPRKGFIYFSDDGDLVALRFDNWKMVFMEQRRPGTLELWAEPFTALRVPKLFNLRTDPFERADMTSNTYWDWYMSKAYMIMAAQSLVGRVPRHVQGVPAAAEGGQLHHRPGDGEDGGRAPSGARPADRLPGTAMVWVPAGHVPHGLGRALPGGGAGAPGRGRRLLDRPRPGHQPASSASSCRPPGTSPSPSGRSTRPTSPARQPENLVPGSMVFTGTPGPVDLRHLSQWWTWTPGASWRHPEGPGSSISRRVDHPVVHVAYEDAEAYAAWAGKELPTEAEWERAARGGLDGAAYVWGDEPEPPGERLANYWHGDFPWRHDRGYGSTAPVGSFPANGYGLHDMAGNVWEWTTDWWSAATRRADRRAAPAARPAPRGQLRPGPAAVPHPAQDDQGRLLPVRGQLLPALPTRRPATADGRHRHEPHRLPLHHAWSRRRYPMSDIHLPAARPRRLGADQGHPSPVGGGRPNGASAASNCDRSGPNSPRSAHSSRTC